jgi:hypothetical protein
VPFLPSTDILDHNPSFTFRYLNLQTSLGNSQIAQCTITPNMSNTSTIQVQSLNEGLHNLHIHKTNGTTVRLQPAIQIKTAIGDSGGHLGLSIDPFAIISLVQRTGFTAPTAASMPYPACGLSSRASKALRQGYGTGNASCLNDMLSIIAPRVRPHDSTSDPKKHGTSVHWNHWQSGSSRDACTVFDTTGSSVPDGCICAKEIGVEGADHGITGKGQFGKWILSEE